ncbi:MAG: glycoside hydrolase family 38 C-terminal domain-containing protein [Victivallaceae bacterium]|nr:glycoside hydrolase family 38 C-terminal domain-containing protein [Victivallaceae bacterium]
MFSKKYTDFRKMRSKRLFSMTEGSVFAASEPLKIEYANSSQKVIPFEKRLEQSYRSGKIGDVWGAPWENAWFHLSGKVPRQWKGKSIALHLDLSGESLLFDRAGDPFYGFCHGSVFDARYTKTLCRLTPAMLSPDDDEVDFWIESTAGGLAGLVKPIGIPSGLKEAPTGTFDARILQARLVVVEEEIAALRDDLTIVISLLESLPPGDYRCKIILQALEEADVAFHDSPSAASECRRVLATVLALPAMASAGKVTAVGHAHIDIAWYWRMREAIRKSARTFASQIYNIERYPGYVFGASQPHNYQSVKQNYPGLYRKIKEKIRQGSWELQGGMWVEADCNLTSGESLVRQFLHGKNFFMDEFGVEVKSLWLPDVFGYSAALPQIIRLARCDSFLTQKLSWNQFNKFPYHMFLWEGIDGSRIFTHFPPEDTYNADLSPEQLARGENNFSEHGVVQEFLSLFGIGDGGGGPSENYIERGLRMRSLEGVPRVQFGKAESFLSRMAKEHTAELPVWRGELYFELHRGTLTSQAKTKQGNRRCEQTLAAAEFLASALPLQEYPRSAFDHCWKKLLSHQFHDILPGSSIEEVYRDTEKAHREILDACGDLVQRAAARLFPSRDDAAVVVNSLSCPYAGCVEMPESWDNCMVSTSDGTLLPCQREVGKRTVVELNLPALSFTTLRRISGAAVESERLSDDAPVLENDLVRYEFAEDGSLRSAFDKTLDRELLRGGRGGGNRLALYPDRPANEYNEAWDVDVFTRDFAPEYARSIAPCRVFRGTIRDRIEFSLMIGKSEIRQTAILERGQKELRFETTVLWNEERKLLQTGFPLEVFAGDAAYDIQYGFVRRPTHTNTSWDFAKFETPVHRYVDVSTSDGGAALLNDCKYACTVRDSEIMLSLLRAARYPDYHADNGEQHFAYGFLPHEKSLEDSEVIAQSACFNRRPMVLDKLETGATIPAVAGFQTDGGVGLEVVKCAEKKDAHVLRLVELKGRCSKGQLKFHTPVSIAQCDLLEWEEKPLAEHATSFDLELAPFAIRTLLVRTDE